MINPNEQPNKTNNPKPKRRILPPGEYIVGISSVEATTTKKGDPMVVFEFTVIDDSFKYDGFKFIHYLPSAYINGWLNICSVFNITSPFDETDQATLEELFLGKLLVCETKLRTYNNKEYVTVVDLHKIGMEQEVIYADRIKYTSLLTGEEGTNMPNVRTGDDLPDDDGMPF